jgi:hypothetical protein
MEALHLSARIGPIPTLYRHVVYGADLIDFKIIADTLEPQLVVANASSEIHLAIGTMELASRQIGQGGLVITMFDYFRMIGDYKGIIERFLSDFNQSCVLFVGYAFMDMDIGAELFRLRQDRKDSLVCCFSARRF